MDSEMMALGMVEDDAAVTLVNGTDRPLWFDPSLIGAPVSLGMSAAGLAVMLAAQKEAALDMMAEKDLVIAQLLAENERLRARLAADEVTGLEVRGG